MVGPVKGEQLKNVSARVREDVYEKLRQYATVNRLSIHEALNHALKDWLECQGQASLEPHTSDFERTLDRMSANAKEIARVSEAYKPSAYQDDYNHSVMAFPALRTAGNA